MYKRLILVAFLLLIIAGCSKVDNGQSLADRAPDFRLPAVDGSMVDLADYTGSVVLVEFWATWCPTCTEMIPVLKKLHQRYKEKGVVILGISLDRGGLQELGAFVHEKMIPYKILMGGSRITNAFGGVSVIPTLYMVDREGRLVRKLIGYHTLDQLEDLVEKYL